MRAVVLGCGRVGAGLARELTARDVAVVVVDPEPDALARLGGGFPGRTLAGSALDRRVLDEAGLTSADAVAAVTGRDEINAAVALTARRSLRVPVVVARLFDPRTAEVYQRLGVRTLAPITWGIQRLADLVTATTVTSTTTIGAGGVELVEVRIPGLLDGRPVTELEVDGEIEVVALTHHGRTRLTTPASRLRSGDLAHVAVTAASLGRLETLLTHR